MAFSKQIVEKILNLSHIKLSQDELDRSHQEFHNIIVWLKALENVDTRDVSPTQSILHTALQYAPEIGEMLSVGYNHGYLTMREDVVMEGDAEDAEVNAESDLKNKEEYELEKNGDDKMDLAVGAANKMQEVKRISREKLMNNAPKEKFGYFVVPKTV